MARETITFKRGVYLPRHELWLDPWDRREFAFVSHAHSDHSGKHERAILSEGTSRLMRARIGKPEGREEVLAFGERRLFDGFSATLLPAGHVLGSSQLLLEDSDGSLLYTGDFKLRDGLSSEKIEWRQADTLIMETTYGLPRYCFPPAEEVIAEIVKFAKESLEDGEVPVLFGYSLGKAQEILHALSAAGLPIMLHGAVHKITEIYAALGIRFPEYEPYDAGRVQGHVLICPPNASGSRMILNLRRRRTAAITGWALMPGAVYRYQCDAVFPLSDHAGYDDLLRYVELVNPNRVLTLHGSAVEFARDLRARGTEAWALTGDNQLELTGVLMPETPHSSTAIENDAELERSPFGKFCLVCRRIRATTGKLEKIGILRTYFRTLGVGELESATTWLTGRPFPASDPRPVQTGWSIIRRALLNATGIPEAEFRNISRGNNDTGLTAREVLALHANPSGKFRLADVQGMLMSLRDLRGPLAKIERLTDVYRKMAPSEGEFLTRILTGELRIGLKEGLVEEAIAAAFEASSEEVRVANMLTGDIGHAATLASRRRLREAGLIPFRPVRCMLASPEQNAEDVWQRMSGADQFPGQVWLEDKMDGIRAQLHRVGGRIEIFSRDLRPVGETFPELTEAAGELAHDVILDGEVLAYDGERPMPFFELQKRLGRRQRDLFLGSEVPVYFMAFDLLWVDGRSLLREPLETRRRELEKVSGKDRIRSLPVHHAADAAAIDEAFRLARERGNEGLIAKDPLSTYTPGRRGLAWVKLKKEFGTLDVVIVAAEYGHGKRKDVLSDYTFAVSDPTTNSLQTIGKAYSGLTDAEIADLTRELLGIVTGKQGRKLLVDPRIVLEIAFDSIQESKRHTSGLALRFPRIKAIRRDKGPDEIDTVVNARRMMNA